MSQRGFTLIEMAIVLTIAGIVIGGGLLSIGPILDTTRINQTNSNMDQVENALELFVIRNNRLPCPALGNIPPTDVRYGLEQPVGGAAACSATGVGVNLNGVLPWRTLGLNPAFAVDGWGNQFSFYPAQAGIGSATQDLTDPTLSPLPMTRNGPTYMQSLNLTAADSFSVVLDASSGAALTPATTTAGTVIIADQAAYVLISHGKSGWYGWSKNGTLHPAQFAGGYKSCNSTPGTCVRGANSFLGGNSTGRYPPTSNTYFDDIVRWRSAAFMIQLCGVGSCGN